MIKVTYDGKYPNSCSGTLTIVKDGKEIYSDGHCCHSTGSVTFDKDWCEYVETGELVWDDADEFEGDVQDAVSKVLSGVHVCCGGCV